MKIDLDAVNRKREGPLYRQLTEVIRGAILSGIYEPGERVEPELDFMREGGFSNRTVGRAFKELVDEGLVVRKKGSGSFVRDAASAPRRNTKALGVVYKDIKDEIFVRIHSGIQAECRSHGYGTFPVSIGAEPGGEDKVLRELACRNIAGILAIPDMTARHHRQLIRMIPERMPVVLMDSYLPEIASDAVVVNNRHATLELTQALIEMGHAQIACLSCPFKYPYCTALQERIAGFRLGLREAGIEEQENEVIILPSGYTIAGAIHRALGELLSRPPGLRPTAIMCVHDRLARDVLEALRGLRVRVPQEISVTGFDDMSFVADLKPPLTTVHQPFERVGREAASLFFDRLLYPQRQAVRIVLDAGLQIRQSAAPPPVGHNKRHRMFVVRP